MSVKSYVNIKNKYDRLVVLIDMDCFYCQVEHKLKPELKGRPIAVVQYNAWKGGGIIAVNYEARSKGVTRHMRGDEAKAHCPEIELVTVPVMRGKADLTKYRDAGKEVADVLQKFTPLLERASVDEAYLDITAKVGETMKLMNEGHYRLEPQKLLNTYATGFGTIGEFVQNLSIIVDSDDLPDIEEEDVEAYKKSDIKLLIAAAIVNEIRASVKLVTGYECSAGIAHNKILAKLACGLNKPNKQTLLPLCKIPGLLAELPLNKIKGLGGKLGESVVEKLNIKFVGDLRNFTEQELQTKIDEKNGSWLYLIARGVDLECVQPKFLSKSIGCSKNFPGRTAIQGIQTLTHWLGELSSELTERLEKDEIDNSRRGKQLVVGFTQTINKEDISSSRANPLNSFDSEAIANDALDIIKKNTEQFFKTGSSTILNNSIKHLSISVGKFEDIGDRSNRIQVMFSNQTKRKETESKEDAEKTEQPPPVPRKPNKLEELFTNHRKSNMSQVEKVEICAAEPNRPNIVQEMFKSAKKLVLSDEQIKKKENDILEIFNSFDEESLDVNQPLIKAKSVAKINNEVLMKPSFFQSYIKEVDDGDVTEPLSANSTNEMVQLEPGPSTSTDYKNTYIEFHRPVNLDELKQVCPKCNSSIPEYEYQSHLDFHFALELSQQQRVEFRTELKVKTGSTPPPNKKIKTSTESGKITPIDRFLIKNDETSKNANHEKPKETCLECGKFIEIEKMIEHSDYHAARKLQTELNQTEPVATPPKPIAMRSSAKLKKSKPNAIHNICVPESLSKTEIYVGAIYLCDASRERH